MELYFYANNQDLSMIFDKTIIEFSDVSSDFQKYEVFFADGKFCYEKSDNSVKENGIAFFPCWISRNYIQPGCLYLDKKTDNISEKRILFSKIKKAINNKYMLSQDRSYYIGPSMYSDWINRKYRFPCLLSYDNFEVESKYVELETLFDELQSKGYIVRSQKCYMINEEYIERDTDHYVVFNDVSSMEFSIIDDIILYEYGSECIHIVGMKRAGRKVYSFIIDKRISICKTNAVTQLFKTLMSYFL